MLAVIGWDGFLAQLGCTPLWFVGEEAKGGTSLCGERTEGQEGVDILGFMDKTIYQVDRLVWPLSNCGRSQIAALL